MNLNFDVVIIGAGVAGMTAAIYLKRSGIRCCLLEREIPGGQINKSSSVKNYPGFLDISGPDLSNNIFQQVKELDITYKYGNVLRIEAKENYKVIKTDLEDITAKNIIIATGRKSRKLGLLGEDKLLGRGVSYCALCDANFFKDQDVAVIGGSNSAFEEAIYLSSICRTVTIVHRKDEFTADAIFQDKIKNMNNIHIKLGYQVKEFCDKNDKLDALVLIDEKNREEILNVSGCFIYVGQVPSNEAFRDILEFDSDGYIKVDEHNETNIKGIYAAGDIVKKDAYQLLTAMSDGVITAVNCIKDMKNH